MSSTDELPKPEVDPLSTVELSRQAAELSATIDRLEPLASRVDRIVGDQAAEIERRAYQRLWKPVGLALAVLGTGFGISVWRALVYIDTQIEQQFAKPRVEATLFRVAEGRAAEILDKRVSPAVRQAERFIEQEKLSLQDAVASIREEFRDQLAELKVQVQYQVALRSIQRLQDEAVEGRVGAFEELAAFAADEPELRARSRGALMTARNQYTGATKAGNFSFELRSNEGEGIPEAELALSFLTRELVDAPQPIVRMRAARLLRNRRESGVVEALESAMASDADMWVRVEALRAYAQIVGYNLRNTFDFTGATEHYRKNRNEIDAKLEEPTGRVPARIE